MNLPSTRKPLLLITGSSGLIGARLVEALSDEYCVVGLDIEPPKETTPDTTWTQCDLTDAESVLSALHQVEEAFGDHITSVIHLAAYYDFSGEPSSLYRDLTVEGTQRLLRQLQRLDVEQFVFASTLLVLKSSADGRPLHAFSPIEAEWDYPRSKLAAEQVIEEERNEIPAVILRMAGVYDEDCHSLPIAQQIRRIYEQQLESYFFPGDTAHGQAFIHLDDLVECIRHVVQRRTTLAPCDTFVIGEEDLMSYEELQDELGKLIHGKEWPAIRIPKAVAKAGAWVKEKLAGDEEDAPFIKPWMIDLADQNYPVSLRRARSSLGWEPHHTLRRTLPEMIGRLLHEPKRWYEINGLPTPDGIATSKPAGVNKS